MESNEENAYLKKDEREPEPHIVTIMAKLDLHVVCLPSRDRGHPHRFIACGSCKKGLEPQEAVTHAAGAKTRGGHNIDISLAQRRALMIESLESGAGSGRAVSSTPGPRKGSRHLEHAKPVDGRLHMSWMGRSR
jgi:hypothetical protein